MLAPTLTGPLTCLVTGAAGFIGYHLCERLLADGHRVVGVDNFNAYYSVALKRARMAQLTRDGRFEAVELDVTDREATARLFAEHTFDAVLHLAAQAGVRYSIGHPHAYAAGNVGGFVDVLEGCRQAGVKHLVYASSSSVYGANTKQPFAETDRVDHPVSLYGASKKANELMAHAYSHLYGLPTTGLRLFTVYGPWGRPDMAYYRFARAILAGEPIAVYNEGRMARDFTFVDDAVDGIVRALVRPPEPSADAAPYRLYNVASGQPVALLDFVATLERVLGRKARVDLQPMQPGDVLRTYGDVSALGRDTGYAPATALEEGLREFVVWLRAYDG